MGTWGVLTVVGGRMVLTKGTSPMSSGTSYPVNGQQLMMQLDSVTSSLMDMAVSTEEGSMETEQSQQQIISAQQQQQQQQHQRQQQKFLRNTAYQSHQKCVLWDY